MPPVRFLLLFLDTPVCMTALNMRIDVRDRKASGNLSSYESTMLSKVIDRLYGEYQCLKRVQVWSELSSYRFNVGRPEAGAILPHVRK